MTIEEIKQEYRTGDYQTVAALTGLHPNTIMNHVHGKHTPKPDNERRIMEAWTAVIGERRKWKAELRKRLTHQN